ncbi:hypothetical protein [Candidatus Amarolinea dominans]|uniref:hypothetical protein n=1 Tax=Candidatus Amarolinea dominans TaxID=3140696 RepID=UPI001D9625CC|nr:hypothetical protein [Anaerolineae bacterium]
MDAVRAFFGEALTLRRSIFLGDANALMIPQAALLPLLDAVNTEFVIAPPGLTGSAAPGKRPIRSICRASIPL